MCRWLRRSRPILLLAAGLFLMATALALASPMHSRSSANRGRLIVHEWGTFLSVQGSDGSSLGGMVDSEESLPLFVRERSLGGRSRHKIFQKMETPVTYFYVDQPRSVQVRVSMPQGLLTHWYPAVRSFGPALDTKAKDASPESFLDWGTLDLMPDSRVAAPVGSATPAGFLPVSKDDTWRFVRETDAAFVRRGPGVPGVQKEGEVEKFLFYRGLGRFDLPLHVRSEEAKTSARLTFHNRGHGTLRGLFLIQVERDGIRFAPLADLPGDATHQCDAESILSSKQSLASGVPHVKAKVADALVRSGLYVKEGQAMVNNWEKSYFQTEGLRVLYVIPRGPVDGIIPIQIKPVPDELVRVMIGRVELLTPGSERRIAQAVLDTSAHDPAVRKAAKAELERLGRLQEPALNRMLAWKGQPDVKAHAEALLKGMLAKR